MVPKIDGTVMVLKQGQYFQKIGVLESLQKDNFSAAIQIFDDNVCLKLKYDEFSKIPWYLLFLLINLCNVFQNLILFL